MKSKTFSLIALVAALTVLPGVGIANPPAPVATAAQKPAVSPPTPTFRVLPYRAPFVVPKEFLGFGPCKLGSTCMAMDERQFAPCLVSTKPCADQARKREVGKPQAEDPVIKISR